MSQAPVTSTQQPEPKSAANVCPVYDLTCTYAEANCPTVCMYCSGDPTEARYNAYNC